MASRQSSRLKDIARRVELKPLDDRTRWLVVQRRLEAFEKDGDENAFEEVLVAGGDEMEEEEVFTKKKKTQLKTRIIAKPIVSLARLIQEQTDSLNGSTIPCYATAKNPPSVLPPRKICFLCGSFSSYSCMRCGVKTCSRYCENKHLQTSMACNVGR